MTPTAGFSLGAAQATADGWRFAIELPGDTRLCAGHFPGRPVLPAIAHLALVTAARQAADGRRLAAVDSLRLSRPVTPGERLVLELAAGETGDTESREGFRLLRAATADDGRGDEAEEVSRGRLVWRPPGEDGESPGDSGADEDGGGATPGRPAGAAPAKGQASGSDPADDPSSLRLTTGASDRLPLAELLPHAPPARLVEAVLARSTGRIICRGRVPAASPFASGGRAPAFVGLELTAQAAAVLEALTRIGTTGVETGGPRQGYLVRVRGARLAVAEVEAEATLVAELELRGGVPPLALYHGRVTGGGRELLTASLTTYLLPAD